MMRASFTGVLLVIMTTSHVFAQSDGGGGSSYDGGGGSYSDSPYGYGYYGHDGGTAGSGGSCDSECSKVVGIVFGSIAGAILVVCGCCYVWRGRGGANQNVISSSVLVSVAAVQHKLSANLPGGAPINARFPTRPCTATGTYQGHADSPWNKGSFPTSISPIVFANGSISGRGCDSVGLFTVEGVYADATGEFQWVKSYTGTGNQIQYRGVASGEAVNRLTGTWKLLHKNDHGIFELELVQNSL